MNLMTQRISNDAYLSRVIVNFQLIVLDQLEPSLLPRFQIRLGKDVLQTFVVCIYEPHSQVDSDATSVRPLLLPLTQDHE
jgi:hypothetical protein